MAERNTVSVSDQRWRSRFPIRPTTPSCGRPSTESSAGCMSSNSRCSADRSCLGQKIPIQLFSPAMSVDRFALESGHSTSRGVITGFDPKRSLSWGRRLTCFAPEPTSAAIDLGRRDLGRRRSVSPWAIIPRWHEHPKAYRFTRAWRAALGCAGAHLVLPQILANHAIIPM
jgi:hypothetical protein